jgi:hypothetical protein
MNRWGESHASGFYFDHRGVAQTVAQNLSDAAKRRPSFSAGRKDDFQPRREIDRQPMCLIDGCPLAGGRLN